MKSEARVTIPAELAVEILALIGHDQDRQTLGHPFALASSASDQLRTVLIRRGLYTKPKEKR